MFQVTNNEGRQIARYDHQSEVETFLKASVPGGEYNLDFDANPGAITIFDKDNNEQYRVTGPKVKDWQKGNGQ